MEEASSLRDITSSFYYRYPLIGYPSYTTTKLPMTAPKQHKQRYYYIFWSLATLVVVLGQIYVASSYKSLASALREVLIG